MAVEATTEEELYDQPIDLLVNLAEEGEIDPWNLDIVEITDRFLSAVNAMDRKGLKVCGETLLYASVLLRMKSDELLEDEEEDEYYPEMEWEPAPMNPLWEDPPELEPPVRREAPRPATLPELIDELKNAAHRCELRERREEHRVEEEVRTQEQVKELPHKERIEESIDDLTAELRGLFEERDRVPMAELAEGEGRHETVSVFLPLLFMDARGGVELEQSELYDEVTVAPGPDLRSDE